MPDEWRKSLAFTRNSGLKPPDNRRDIEPGGLWNQGREFVELVSSHYFSCRWLRLAVAMSLGRHDFIEMFEMNLESLQVGDQTNQAVFQVEVGLQLSRNVVRRRVLECEQLSPQICLTLL